MFYIVDFLNGVLRMSIPIKRLAVSQSFSPMSVPSLRQITCSAAKTKMTATGPTIVSLALRDADRSLHKSEDMPLDDAVATRTEARNVPDQDDQCGPIADQREQIAPRAETRAGRARP
jgi:hypothetical protein